LNVFKAQRVLSPMGFFIPEVENGFARENTIV
jgi:hypothetical protein